MVPIILMCKVFHLGPSTNTIAANEHSTGEVPWVREILQKFDRIAKSNKAILIPEIGIEAAPSDLVAYTAVSTIRDVHISLWGP
jgi:hypothetical protein